MKKRYYLGLFAAILLLSSHDMYLKLDQYFLAPNTQSVIQLFNGTFDRSDNVITRDRMLDVSLVGKGKRISVDSSNWFERDSITFLNFTTGEVGTWVAGVSTRARSLGMSGEAFSSYLEHDGVLDVLESRKQQGTLGDTAIEKYSKHVKTIFQVGDELTDDYKTVLGYPIEFLALDNPYDIHPGHDLPVQLLFDGKPLPNQLVYVGFKGNSSEHTHDGSTHTHGDEEEHTHDDAAHTHDDEAEHTHDEATHSHGDEEEHTHDGTTHSHGDEEEHTHDGTTHSHGDEEEHTHDGTTHSHEEEDDHQHDELLQLRTDEQGRLNVPISSEGVWYLRTIHLVEVEEEGLTHESNWATLTFAVGDGHAHEHAHEGEEHSHEEGLPGYVYLLISLLIVVVLFFWFKRNK